MRLEANHISYRYPNAEGEVFNDLSLCVERAGFHALFGPSGVGKTTLARMLTGAIAGFDGAIRTDGVRRVLYTYNLERLPGWSSVREHLDADHPGRRPHAPGRADRRLRHRGQPRRPLQPPVPRASRTAST